MQLTSLGQAIIGEGCGWGRRDKETTACKSTTLATRCKQASHANCCSGSKLRIQKALGIIKLVALRDVYACGMEPHKSALG